MYRGWFISFICLIFSLNSLAAGSYESGLDAYREGRDSEARLSLEQALVENPGNDGACLYLGILYQKGNQMEKAEQIMLRGIGLSGESYYELLFNLANLYYNLERFEEAEVRYNSLAASLNPFRTKALLNRANMAVTTQDYQQAIDDYLNYLMEEPETSRRDNIEKMVALLKQYLQEEEDKLLAEEERRRQEEEVQRLAEEEQAQKLAEEARQREVAEQKRLEEDARQKALMAEILNSLSTAGNETESFTAESESVQDEFEESDLDD